MILAIPVVVLAIPDLEKRRFINTWYGNRIPINPVAMDFGKDDWTMEYWTKRPKITDFRVTKGWSRYVAQITLPDDNNWHHIATVHKSGQHTTYLDGEVV